MTGKVRVAAFSVSIDGFGAGPTQSLDAPMGVGGMALHEWAFHTRTARSIGLLGRGEPLVAGLDLRGLGYQCSRHVTSDRAMHVVLTKDGS